VAFGTDVQRQALPIAQLPDIGIARRIARSAALAGRGRDTEWSRERVIGGEGAGGYGADELRLDVGVAGLYFDP
jgi:hypothetical protein